MAAVFLCYESLVEYPHFTFNWIVGIYLELLNLSYHTVQVSGPFTYSSNCHIL